MAFKLKEKGTCVSNGTNEAEADILPIPEERIDDIAIKVSAARAVLELVNGEIEDPVGDAVYGVLLVLEQIQADVDDIIRKGMVLAKAGVGL